MAAGKDEYAFKQDDTRLEGKMTDPETTEMQEERTRLGTIVDTRAATAGATAQSGSDENDPTRIGTKVDTRGPVAGGGSEPASSDRMRDGS
jgi:hypothetical protein